MPLNEFSQIVAQLLRNYVSVGWPFALVHAILAVAFAQRYRALVEEVRELQKWMPNQPGQAHYTSARILAQFVSDCDRHGQKGSLIPMTDYSDRLDAHIGHSIAALATRANLFLIAGVMGTFFALFQFAFEAQGGLAPEAIGSRLSQGLASAFPIGLVGLALTMFAHLLTDTLEGSFRQQAETKVHEALAARSEKLTTVESAVIEAVEPLKNLEATLSRTLQPVIEGFRDQLRHTHQIMAQQVQPLTEVVDRLERTTSEWKETMKDFREASSAYYRLMRESAEISRQNLGLIKSSRKIFDDLDQVIQASAGALVDASNRMSAVPQVLSDRLAETMESMTRRVEEAWRESSHKLFVDLAESAAGLRSSAKDLTVASAQLRSLPEDIGRQTALCLSRQQDQLVTALAEMQNQFVKASAEMSERAEKIWSDGAAWLSDRIHDVLISDLKTIRDASEEARKKLAEAADSLIDFADHYRNTINAVIPNLLEKAVEELQPYLIRLDQAICSNYPRVMENLQQAVETTARFQQILQEAAAEAERIRAAIHGAADEFLRASAELKSQQRQSAGTDGYGTEELIAELKSLLQTLPDRVVSGLARRDKRGAPVLMVKEIPFWRRIL
jgi:hemerythrin-like domain-containing protein